MYFSWTTVFVTDIEKSIDFYSRLLGLPIALKSYSPQQKMVMLGNKDQAKIELIENKNVSVKAGNDSICIGFMCENLEEATKSLIEAGYHLMRGPVSHNEHITFSFFKDPDGYKVQICEEH